MSDLKKHLRQQFLKWNLWVRVQCPSCQRQFTAVVTKQEYYFGKAVVKCECGDEREKLIVCLIERE